MAPIGPLEGAEKWLDIFLRICDMEMSDSMVKIDQNQSKIAHRVPKVAKIGYNRLTFLTWCLFTTFLYDSDIFTADSKANIDKIAIWMASRALNSPQRFFRQKKNRFLVEKKNFFLKIFDPKKIFFKNFFRLKIDFFFWSENFS